MSRISRFSPALALAALAFATAGCAGDSGTQPTSLDRTLVLQSGVYYTNTTTVGTVHGAAIAPIARFNAKDSQSVLLFGSRDTTTGSVTSVRESVYTSPDVKPLYAKYNADGGLASVKDSDTGSYITVSALETSGNSVVATGVDGTTGKTGSVRLTLSDVGVTVVVLDDGGRAKGKPTVVPLPAGLKSRVATGTDPIAGFETVYKDSATRNTIITTAFRVASLVVEKPFSDEIRDVAGFLLLDQLEASYADFRNGGLSLADDATGTTPQPYKSDLP